MMPVFIIVGLFVVYELLTQHVSANALSPTAGAVSAPLSLPAYTLPAASATGQPSTVESVNVTGAAVALNFVPVVGPILSAAFSAIAGSLMKASAQRAAQARNENSAVAAGVIGWDKGLAQIVQAYNSGSITGSEAAQLCQLLMTNYWNEVTPQIQPGRNACHGGADPMVYPVVKYCSGGYGAACCVGYTDLLQSLQGAGALGSSGKVTPGVLDAIAAAEANPGMPVKAPVYKVFASKYGGIDRPTYYVTFTKPSPVAAGITAPVTGFLQSIGL
jgi:hypothetical protein